ncbi:hypothetical protein BAU15_03455 [Enterococcus sp. JM4C]|uniref:SpaH/EbpB family LPXTG-anchored major pilin n=1 Tax=Candidatus Enterococcus huntleyi TaxID=1857217 RepID=UPI00137A282C|nr:SpaH/EbpB family LPXTG-anchored major pilin [Enterococcus sp. JM4C]KAF1295611.1 hypothetical protein BAU15_03455 [Enterococcus sp. JM4C]
MKTKTKKLLTKAVVATTLFTAVGFAPLGSVLVAQAEDISADAIADTFSHRSITLWKYQVRDAADLGDRGTGIFDPTVDKLALPGIKFTLQRVIPVNGDTSLTDSREQFLGTHYTIDPTFTPETITTDADGKAYFDLGVGRANDGIYLVTELPDDRTDLTATEGKKVGVPADPFFVYVPQTNRTDLSTLIYDVQVQPKNILESLVNPDKTINGIKGDSVHAAQEFQWELAAKVPAGLWQVATQPGKLDIYDADGNKLPDTYDMVVGQPITVSDPSGLLQPNFSMTDTLHPDLEYKADSAKMQVKQGDGGPWTDLDPTDYTVTFDPATNTLVTKLTEAGLTKVGTEANGFTDIRTILVTTVPEQWNGIVENDFTVNYQIPGQEPKTVTPPPLTQPKYFTGGFDIEKTAEDTKGVLADAEFMIAFTKEDAEAGTFIGTDGNKYAKGATLPTGVELIKATSDADGKATFDGLALDWTDANSDNYVQDSEVERTYWVVETKAPADYEELKVPVEVVVNLATADDDSIELDIVNKRQTKLPFTGGEGTTILVAIALGAITVGTVAIMVDKKRRKA